MKHYGKLTAAAAAGFMALSAMGVTPVFAEDPVVVTPGNINGTYTLTKTLEHTDNVTPADAVTFEYEITPTGKDDYDASANPGTPFKGIEGAVTFSDTTASTDKKTYTTVMTADASKFPGPGIYTYTLSEKAVDKTASHNEGIKEDDDESYAVNVVVELKNGDKQIQGISATKTGSTEKATALSFAAKYDPSYLLVTKNTTGNQDVADTVFTFKLNITGQDGEQYRVSVVNAAGEVIDTTKTETKFGASAEFTDLQVTSGQSIKVVGLSSSDKYTVTETNDQGYTPDTINGVEQTFGQNTDKTITFTNTKSGKVPTGILMTAAPYAGLVGLGGIFAGLFFRRKKED